MITREYDYSRGKSHAKTLARREPLTLFALRGNQFPEHDRVDLFWLLKWACEPRFGCFLQLSWCSNIWKASYWVALLELMIGTTESV